MKVQGTTIITSNQKNPKRMLYSKYPRSIEKWMSMVLGPRDKGISTAPIGLVLDILKP